MEKQRMFYDIENGNLISEKQLRNEFEELKEEKEYESISFEQYIKNCLTISNGSLEEIK